MPDSDERLAGIVLTGDLRPNPNVLKVILTMPIPVLVYGRNSYDAVASKVHDLTCTNAGPAMTRKSRLFAT